MRLSTSLRLAAAFLLAAPLATAQNAKTLDKASGDPAPVQSSLAPPANDNFANAITITAPGELLSSTVDATLEAGEPTIPAACGVDNTGKSVWFKFTGTGTAVTFDTANSALAPGSTAVGFVDTILSVYSGTTLTGLTQVACNDDDPTNPAGGGDFTSRVENVPTIAGTTYYVRVSSFFGGAGTFDRSNGEVRLASTGTFTQPTGPSLAATPASVSFGTVQTGTTSTAQTVTLLNNGTAPVTITAITVSGAPFAVSAPTLPVTLAVNGTATFSVRYAPTAAVASTGTVTVASNAAGSPLVINLTGTGDANFTTAVPAGTTLGATTVFNRPSTVGTGASGSCTLSGTALTVPYQARTFAVTTAGSYTITTDFSGTTGFDGYIYLYRTGFAPTDPCLNLVNLDDDFLLPTNTTALQGAQIAAQALTSGNYVLVVTGFGNTSAGAFTGTVVGPAAVIFTPVASEGSVQDARTFLSAAPNPAAAAARVRFATATAQDVTVSVYDVTGRRVATLFQGAVSADQQMDLGLNTSALAPGVYVVRATGTSLNLTQRVTVVR